MSTATDAFRAQLDSDTRLEPGQQGWWQVWGARTHHIRPGDIVVTKDGDRLVLDEVVEVESRTCNVKITTPDSTFTLGHLAGHWLLFRTGTHNTLAD